MVGPCELEGQTTIDELEPELEPYPLGPLASRRAPELEEENTR
jgi:hypothetical protein